MKEEEVCKNSGTKVYFDEEHSIVYSVGLLPTNSLQFCRCRRSSEENVIEEEGCAETCKSEEICERNGSPANNKVYCTTKSLYNRFV